MRNIHDSICKFYLKYFEKKIIMTFCDSWEEFVNAAEQLYLNDPSKVCIYTRIFLYYSE